MLYMGFCALAAAAVVAFLAWRSWMTTQALKLKAGPLETARAGSLVNVMGRVRPFQEVLTSPLAGKECVWFDSRIERRSPRTWHDDEGGARRDWTVSVESEEHGATDFVIEDATGRIKVEVEGAQVHFETDLQVSEVLDERDPGLDPTDYRWPERVKKETYVEVGDLVRVVGFARGSSPRKDTENPTMVIGKAHSKVFLVTDKDKGDLLDGLGQRGLVFGIGAALLLGIGVLCIAIGFQPPPEADPIKVDTSFQPLPKLKRPSAD